MKFRRKPEIVEAEQWQPGMELSHSGSVYCSSSPLPLGMMLDRSEATTLRRFEGRLAVVNLDHALVNWGFVKPGQWVTTDKHGNHDVFTQEEFDAAFEPID